MKQLVSLLFATMLATQAFADDFIIDKLKYRITDEDKKEVSVSKAGPYSTPSGDLDIKGKITHPTSNENYTVTSIAYEGFRSCNDLSSVTIPNTVTNIGEAAFGSCTKLKSITIPSSVTYISGYTFENCSALTGIQVAEGNTKYASDNGVLFNKDKTILMSYPGGKTNTSYTIPESVQTIKAAAFKYCENLTSITIPNSVETIENDAFQFCNGLTTVVIGNSVTTIGNDAFNNCDNISSLTLGKSITEIGDRAFYACNSLTTVAFPNSLTTIGNSAFSSCSGLTSVNIPNSVTTIDKFAFSGCSNITTVTIPKSVTSIGKEAFLANATTTIYCETDQESKPNGWEANWDRGYSVDLLVTTIWGCQVIRGAANDESFGSVTANDKNATVKGNDGSLWYLADATNISATLIATPAEGYHFVQWEDDANAAATRTVTAALSQPYKAIFAKDEPTAISTMEQNSLVVSAVGRNILVKNATGEVLVYDTTGRIVARQKPQQQNVISVESRGLYIVKSGNAVVRVIVND